jgi:hypothetical protein
LLGGISVPSSGQQTSPSLLRSFADARLPAGSTTEEGGPPCSRRAGSRTCSSCLRAPRCIGGSEEVKNPRGAGTVPLPFMAAGRATDLAVGDTLRCSAEHPPCGGLPSPGSCPAQARERRRREADATAARERASEGRTSRGHTVPCQSRLARGGLLGGSNPSKPMAPTERGVQRHGRRKPGDGLRSPSGARP